MRNHEAFQKGEGCLGVLGSKKDVQQYLILWPGQSARKSMLSSEVYLLAQVGVRESKEKRVFKMVRRAGNFIQTFPGHARLSCRMSDYLQLFRRVDGSSGVGGGA